MAEHSPIFSAKEDGKQIGYIEGNEAFDLLGKQRCSYNAGTGNLSDLNSGKNSSRLAPWRRVWRTN